MNTIEFSENRTGRIFKASFTDTVGSNISDSFGVFFANKVGLKQGKSSPQNINDDNSELDFQEEEANVILIPENSEDFKFKKIFKSDGEKVSLIEPRLKAHHRRDYGIRIICLYLYYKKMLSSEKVSRTEITQILKQASVEDSNLRKWIKNESTLIRQSNGELELLLPGEEYAREILVEVSDTAVPDRWRLGTKAKTTKKNKAKTDFEDEEA